MRRPEPAAAPDVPKQARSRRARLPRSQSTGNMLDAMEATSGHVKYEPRDTVAEPNVRTNLRDLAKFFRTTAPPVNQGHDNCMPVVCPDSGDNIKRSFQSLIKRRRATKLGTQSLQIQPSDRVIAKKTIEGYPYATIALPDQSDADGPWFRSQYPVFPDASSHQASGPPLWPERTTSRGALSPTYQDQTTPKGQTETNRQLPKHGLDRTESRDGPTRDDFKKFTEARLLVADFLRGLAKDLQPNHDASAEHASVSMEVKEGVLDGDPVLSLPLDSLSRGTSEIKTREATVEFPATPPPSGQLHQFEWPEVVVNSTGPSSPTAPKPLLDRRRQRSLSMLQGGPTSPKSFDALRPLNIGTQNSLVVPKENLLPESPGFPNMLAAMRFPSPPKTPGSPSPVSSLSSGFSTPCRRAPVPIVRPRTSSKNAVTTSAGNVSLNEIIMQPSRRGLSRSKSDYTLSTSKISDILAKADLPSGVVTFASEVDMAGTSPGLAVSTDCVIPLAHMGPARSDSATSFVTACEEHSTSRTASPLSHTDLHWRSVSSVTSATTASYIHSTSTNRQSTRSDATTINTATSFEGSARKDDTSTISARYAVDMWLPGTVGNNPSLGVSDEDSRVEEFSNSPSPTTIDREASKTMGITKRRMARKGRSGDYREGSVDLTHHGAGPALRTRTNSDSLDSPVLGWFPQSRVPARKASIHGPSPLAQLAHSAPIIESTEGSDRSYNNSPTAMLNSRRDNSAHAASVHGRQKVDRSPNSPVAPVKRMLRKAWSISSIMATSNEPTYVAGPAATPRRGDITISPIIVVVDVTPIAVPRPLSGLRLSRLLDSEAEATPSLPLKSPHRQRYTAKRLSRHIPLPVKATMASPSTTRDGLHTDGLSAERGSSLALSVSPNNTNTNNNRALKRLSLPLYINNPDAPLTFWDRPSVQRAAGAQASPQLACEQDSEPEIEPFPRRRSLVVRERFHLAKMAREKEIVELVAKSAPSLPPTPEGEEYTDSLQEAEDAHHSLDNDVSTTDEIEQRIQLLEKHSEGWLSVLDPLLSNMTRTLKEIRTDGQVSPLLMREFIIDMAAEARRSILSSNVVEGVLPTKESITFEDFDGAHQATEPKPEPEMSVRIKKTGRGRSPSRVARLRLPLNQPQETPPEDVEEVTSEPVTGTSTPETRDDILTTPEKSSGEIPRTSQQHEFEAEMVVRRRIEAQELMMDQLMSKWGVPRASQESARPSISDLIGARSKCSSHSRRSSQNTVNMAINDMEEPNPTGASLVPSPTAPLDEYWLEENDVSIALRDNRRNSRRWSSAGETIRWKPGDNSVMNVLMQELRATSRLSLESKADIESLL